jgi:UDP-glucose 4-epimerase
MAEAIDLPAAYNQIFNVGADEPYSLNELAQQVAQAMNVTANIVHVPARREVLHAYSSHEKIWRIFGEQRPTMLAEGLSAMAAWVKRYGSRTSKKYEGIEIMKNFPLAWLQ